MVSLAQGITYEASIPWFRAGFTWVYDGGDKDKYTLLDDKFVKELIFLGKSPVDPPLNKTNHVSTQSTSGIHIVRKRLPLVILNDQMCVKNGGTRGEINHYYLTPDPRSPSITPLFPIVKQFVFCVSQ